MRKMTSSRWMYVSESQKCEMCNARQARTAPTPIQLIPRHSMGGLTRGRSIYRILEKSLSLFSASFLSVRAVLESMLK